MKNVLFAVAMSIACGGSFAAEHRVKMLNAGADGSMVFEPGFLQVAKGDTVKFIKIDAAHNTASAVVPAGAAGWKGKPDEEVSVTLNQEGVYVYVCDPHKVMAMAGVIQVGKAVNLADAQKQADSLSKSFVVNKDRLSKYMAQVK
ncbi:pseudoazurin [Massilia eurypsychrophila]|jgi:pseudoazurin|uniref:Pseudoazurin n=1 Tax=Massilia eurypsychrophila TaxID=1485217 RepID=A0A2G8TEH3_9BURK|nr:pseudoazurin [Massilia eurypsychrophila]PIL44451.1 pseudoazurin [Massilia eurypsychrophila]